MASQALNANYAFGPDPGHVHRCRKPLLERVEKGEIDPTFVITPRMPLAKTLE